MANADIEGSQCTVHWHVDDNKISHLKPSVVSNVISMIESKFEKMTVARGKKHDFLGMILTFHDSGLLEIDMKEYIKSTLYDFG